MSHQVDVGVFIAVAKGDGPLFPEIRTVPLLHGQVVEGEEGKRRRRLNIDF
jgi:hypothetical protein